MSEMVVLVAEAIWRAEFASREGGDGNPREPPCAWSDLKRSDRDDFYAIARAAIAAMREPTAGMAIVGNRTAMDARAVWRAMIDEALR